ncbi:ATP-binding cassette domain-containing protein [Nonomuraea basaltis]|uniref:ATP-binding cassette domain-containing protein n=1 Tax=Nonomuraea basaltis TaxID=2495887 RepID=UPI001F114660|nr:ATP-binding cassette domain-containing protein [Nonomuraea basaltis]
MGHRPAGRCPVGADTDGAGTGRLPGELSGGQRQRVAPARALAARPAVLICDEVTSALGTVTQAGVLGLLDGLRADLGVAVVLITHDAHVAAAVSDRLLVLADGRVARTGRTGDLLPWGVRPELPLSELLGAPGRDCGAVPEGLATVAGEDQDASDPGSVSPP